MPNMALRCRDFGATTQPLRAVLSHTHRRAYTNSRTHILETPFDPYEHMYVCRYLHACIACATTYKRDKEDCKNE